LVERCSVVIFKLYSYPTAELPFLAAFTRILFVFDFSVETGCFNYLENFLISWILHCILLRYYSSLGQCFLIIQISWIYTYPPTSNRTPSIYTLYDLFYGRISTHLDGSLGFLSAYMLAIFPLVHVHEHPNNTTNTAISIRAR